MSKNTIIDGVAASEHLDSSGESLSIEGMDISSLGGPDSILNWEHGSKDRPGQVVGKVTFAKKIMKKEDAKTKRESYFWNKSKKPFVYIKAELFDGLGHSGAQDVAAMLKYKNKDKGEESRLVVGFSIEGGKIEKKGMTVTKSIARDVAITVKPCNKVCDAEVIESDSSDDFLYKNQEFDCEILEKIDQPLNTSKYRDLILQDIKKSDRKLDTPTQKEIKEIKLPKNIIKISKYESDNNMRKTLIAGMMNTTPDARTGMAALTGEELVKKKVKVMKKSEKISHFFTQPHSIFSVENPYHPTSHSISHEDMMNKLKNKGFDIEPLKGKYGNEENSIVVKNPSEQQKNVLNHIARKLGQDSIIHSDGQNHQMLYLHGEKAGKHLKGVGTQIHNQQPDDFYSTTTSGTHFTHNFDFDNLHKSEFSKLEKMSRPLMQNKELGLGQDPRMDVKYVDPEKEYKIKSPTGKEKTVTAPELESKKLQNKASLKTFKKQPGDILSPKENVKIGKKVYKDYISPTSEGSEVHGQNVGDPDFGINTSYVFKNPNQPKDEIDSGIHETTHGFFSDVANKHGKEHSKQLASHLLNNFFHPNDVQKIKSFIKDRGYEENNPHFNEEHISHIADIINRPSTRKDFFDHASHVKDLKPGSSPEDMAMAQELDRRMHKRLNRGWGNAVNFIKDTNSLKQFLGQVKPTKINKKINKE